MKLAVAIYATIMVSEENEDKEYVKQEKAREELQGGIDFRNKDEE